MTGPSLFRRNKKCDKTFETATESLKSLKIKPQLILPRSLRRGSESRTLSIDSSFSSDGSSHGGSVTSSSDSFVKPTTATRTPTLQARVDATLTARGVSTRTYKSLETAYINTATPLQEASWSASLQDVTPDQLKNILQAGLSPNPVSPQGDSFVHWVCRSGRDDLLHVLMQHGCNVQVCNKAGHTPLHEACRSREPNWRLIERLLIADPLQVHMADKKDALPLSYVRREQRQAWRDFLDGHMDTFWPLSCDVLEQPLLQLPPNTRPIVDPSNALPLKVAAVVAALTMDPQEALCLQYGKEEDEDSGACQANALDFNDCSDSEFSLDENELSEILTLMSVQAVATVAH
jgi:hypothetical protein